jgi:hypothetical protein
MPHPERIHVNLNIKENNKNNILKAMRTFGSIFSCVGPGIQSRYKRTEIKESAGRRKSERACKRMFDRVKIGGAILYAHKGGWMYSAARSRRFGKVHSELPELSGVTGGKESFLLMFTDPGDEAGGGKFPPKVGPKEDVIACCCVICATNAALSFWSARRDFKRGLAH